MQRIGIYFIYFLVYSILGAIAETLFRLVTELRLTEVNGFLHLPVLPIYGAGALLVIIATRSIKHRPVLLFAVSIAVTSALEFIIHWLMDIVFNIKLWDYSAQPLNLDGRIVLLNSVAFGLASLLVVYRIHPIVKKYIFRIPRTVLFPISMFVATVVMGDFILSIAEQLL